MSFNFKVFSNSYTTYIWHAVAVQAQAALPEDGVYKCSMHFVYRLCRWWWDVMNGHALTNGIAVHVNLIVTS